MRSSGGGRLTLLLDAEIRKPEPLARGEGPLLRILEVIRTR